ncbi:MAG TPA: hypothetical protein PK228_03065 [Saprospiraceae bacterium]|nr:hypothetical protein [Saprospiraceae bacterium]
MSDFDKFFADKLDEEGQYPRREKNWRTLSKRLDAFDVGLELKTGSIHRYLRYWQAAAACLVIATGLLTWKLLDVKNQNAGLQDELAILEEKNRTGEQEIALLKASKNLSATDLAGSLENGKKLNPALPSIEVNENRKSASVHHPGNRNSAIPDHVDNPQSVAIDNPDASIPASSEGALPLSYPANQPETLTNSVDGVNNPPDSVLSPFDAPLQVIAGVLLPDSSLQAPSLLKQDTLSTAATPKIIEPARNPSRFRAGIQFLTGLPVPQEKGVSMLIGQGLTTEFNVWQNFWLTASADWLHFDVSTEKYIPKFHSHQHHDPFPPGGSPHEILVKVESTQRQQHYGLGLRYAVPVRTWIRPAFRVAYTMIHTSPELITFKYEDHGPGGPGGPGGSPKPKYSVQKTESQLIQNVWRFGAGLEHDTPGWVFGLWADYSKNFASSDLTFDALTFRAGLQYKFN